MHVQKKQSQSVADTVPLIRVLIVDDEERYLDFLTSVFGQHGYEVRTAKCGRCAIREGIRFRPHVLITDWLLQNQIHGIEVSEVLRAVDPNLQTILITGFPSSDLRSDAEDATVHRLIEKPFELREMVKAVEDAAVKAKQSSEIGEFAVFVVDDGEQIIHANKGAAEFFALTDAGANAKWLKDIFSAGSLEKIRANSEEWEEVSPLSKETISWWMRSHKWPDSRLIVLLPESKKRLQKDLRIWILLEIAEARRTTWPFTDHVLVVDDEKMIRDIYVSMLRFSNCVCYRAASEELAVRLFRADPSIGVVILDYEMPSVDVRSLVPKLLSIRPHAKLVGNSASEHRQDFADIGVTRYLEKPWRLSQLLDILKH